MAMRKWVKRRGFFVKSIAAFMAAALILDSVGFTAMAAEADVVEEYEEEVGETDNMEKTEESEDIGTDEPGMTEEAESADTESVVETETAGSKETEEAGETEMTEEMEIVEEMVGAEPEGNSGDAADESNVEPDIPADAEENVIFNGSLDSGNGDFAQVNLNNLNPAFDMKKVVAGGCFYVEYTASEKLDMKFVLSRWNTNGQSDGKWVEVKAARAGAVSGKNGTYYAQYSFEACKTAYEKEDMSDVNALCVKAYKNNTASAANTDNTGDKLFTLTCIKWYAPNVAPEIPADAEENVIFNGSQNPDSNNIVSVNTQGLQFDMNKVATGGCFYVEYTASEKLEMKFVLSRWNTNNSNDGIWAEVDATRAGVVPNTTNTNKTYYAQYSFEACKGKYDKDNMSDVNQLCVKAYQNNAAGAANTDNTNSTENKLYTLTCIKWYAPNLALEIPTGAEENVIFNDSKASNNSLASINVADTKFNMEKVVANGCFYVEYTAEKKLDLKLALSKWESSTGKNDGKWKEVDATRSGVVPNTTNTNKTYYAQYSFDACKTAYGTENMSDVNALCVKAENQTFTLKALKWYGPEVKIPYELLYKGTSSEQKGPSAGPAHYFYTKHVGGDFDAAQLKLDSYFTLQYTSSGDAANDAGARLTVALSSASDTDNATDNHWVAVTAAETKKLENGEYLSKYTIEDCVKAFGKNVKRLDQIQVYTPYNAAAETVFVLKEMKYYAGDGALVDTDGETAWTNKAKTGIGFIGDSICQNAMLRYNNWNTILNRKDCTDTNWGIGGQNTTQISRRIGDMLSSADYEKIVVLCGINDLGHGITKEQFIKNYTTIIETIHREQAQTQIYAPDSVNLISYFL